MSNSPPHPAHKPALRPAATVLLLREAKAGVEVLVVRRHENMAFMGGLWVFPGGTLCPADVSEAILARVPERSQARCAQFTDLNGVALERRQCLGLTVAAYRETFEETGLLLATTADGRHCGDALLVRVQEHRRAIVSQPELFATLLQQEGLLLEVDRLAYWGHWITPADAPRRFDTRFFAAEVPAQQIARIDSSEAVDHAWMSPAAIIASSAEGKMPVSPPTIYNLMLLDSNMRAHGSLAAVLADATRRQIAPILPKMIRGATTTMVLPWDVDYSNLPGEGAPAHIEYPSWLTSHPSRMTVRL